ncbi:hypothetical protein D1872_203910 [compost metagenome]
MLLKGIDNLLTGADNTLPVFGPFTMDLVKDIHQARTTVFAFFRKVRTREKRLFVRGHNNSKRPTAVSRHGLADFHVDMVDVWAFFTVDFNGDIVLIENMCYFLIFEAFPFHNMAPMACKFAIPLFHYISPQARNSLLTRKPAYLPV